MYASRDACRSTSLGTPASSRRILAPIGRARNGQHQPTTPLEKISDWSTSLGILDSNDTVVGFGDDATAIGRVRNTLHTSNMPH